MAKKRIEDWKEPKQVMKMLHEIEKEKSIYDIHYCKAGVGFVFYTGSLEYKDLPVNWKESLSVDKYYPTFEEAVKAEWDRMKQGDKDARKKKNEK
jgi:effector-binding domain-containing protein